MASTSAVYARIDTRLKEDAESILTRLGISPSSAIQMLYSQVVLRRGLPFAPVLPAQAPLTMDTLTDEELATEVRRGLDSAACGRGIPEEEADAIFAREFGI